MKTRLTLLAAALAIAASAAAEGYKQHSTHAMPFSGVVTFHRSIDDYFFMRAADGSGVWRVQMRDRRDASLLKVGEEIDVLDGETRENSTTRRVQKARLAKPARAKAAKPVPIEYRRVAIEDLYRHPLNTAGAEDLWGEMVSCEGVVRDINRRQSITQIQVGDGDYSFQAASRININTPLPADLKLGATVRVNGIMLYSPVNDSTHHAMTDFTDVSVMPTDINGVEVLSRAPFWTPAKIWAVTGASLGVALVVFLWAALLRRRLLETMRRRVRDEVAFEATHRERLRLSRDLHDDFQQLLAGTMFRIGAAQNMMDEGDCKGAAEQLARATSSLAYTQTQLRTVLWGLGEESEGPASLSGLFRYAAERMAHWKDIVEITSAGSEPRLARMVSGSLLMILQEAVGNALTHGYATKVRVHIDFSGDALTLSITDNGVGFDTSRPVPAGHYGLNSMRERIAHLGGSISFDSTPGKGTAVTVKLTLKASEK